MAHRAWLAYAAAMVIAGLGWAWRAPLSPDESRYYLPAAQFFAERGVPLDYPMPMPPFALVVQGFVYRVSESVYLLRVLSTLAAIAAVATFAVILSRADGEGPPAEARAARNRRGSFGVFAPQDDSSVWLLFMFGTFPAGLLHAFSLKHHSLLLLCCVGALALWQRQRIVLATLLLTIGALTHQFTGAMIATLVVLSLLERRHRDAAILACSALPLLALVLFWRGARPPMHESTFTGEPAMSGLQPVQLLVLLFMAGAWIAPALRIRWIVVAAAAVPLTIWMYTAGLMRSTAGVYDRLAGPVSSLIGMVTRHNVIAAAILAGALAALGAALVFEKRIQFGVWSAMYAVVVLAVPYFFESYYALFVCIGWVILRKEIAERPPWFPIAATLAGVAYVVVKA